MSKDSKEATVTLEEECTRQMCRGLQQGSVEEWEELVWLEGVSEGRIVQVKELRRGRSCRR